MSASPTWWDGTTVRHDDDGTLLANALQVAARETLRGLDGRLFRFEKDIAPNYHGRKLADGTMQWGGFEIEVQRHVKHLHDAHGVFFQCPKCFEKNGGSVGTHYVMAIFRDREIPPDEKRNAARWTAYGRTIDDLSLSQSINVADCGSIHVENGSAG